jgi:hypothetical protein
MDNMKKNLRFGLAYRVGLLALVAWVPVALAQKGPNKPKKGAPAASASASASETPPPPPPPAPEPSASAAAETPDTKAAQTKEEKPAEPESDITDVAEKDGVKYYFLGLRYRGTVIPKFMINLFVDEGATVYSNSIGIELDMRKDGFSLIPNITYTEYGTDDILFKQKSKPDVEQNWSVVNSSLKAIYLGTDLLWSASLSKNIDFEYGAGFGLGFIFGDLMNNWVYDSGTTGAYYASSNGHHYNMCQTVDPAHAGCTPGGHSNSDVNKVGGYTEPSWVNGGSKPNVFPRITFPLLGLRIKPIKQFEGRLQVGFSITEGFLFGFSGNYGFERPGAEKKSSGGPALVPARSAATVVQ